MYEEEELKNRLKKINEKFFRNQGNRIVFISADLSQLLIRWFIWEKNLKTLTKAVPERFIVLGPGFGR